MKALALLSGGLDSALAIKLILNQGIDVVALQHVLPFIAEKKDYAGQLAERFGIPLIKLEAGEDYIEIVRNPRYGYGYRMNPCTDCRIYMLREAKRVAEEIGAGFLITGDVLAQRPMSQNRDALRLEEREAALQGMILRPLSAKLLPKTVPERKGWVDRDSLLGIRGKSKRRQIQLAREFGLDGYRYPIGGCLLTNQEFSLRLKALFAQKEKITKTDALLLKIGRHYFCASSRIIVGRKERENRLLLELKSPEDYIFEVPGYGSPITLLQGPMDEVAKELAARLTARYSDADTREVVVEYRTDSKTESIVVELGLLQGPV